jgi:dipeptidyl aminopeptidase/acylaminoacyl peptidase
MAHGLLRLLTFPAAWLMLLAMTASLLSATERIPVEVFARGTEMGAPELSPSGNKLAYVAYVQGKPLVIVRDLIARTERAVLSGEINDFTIKFCWFKTEERLVCQFHGTAFVLGNPYAVSRMLAINIDSSAAKVLIQNGAAGGSQFQDRILHRLPDDPDNVLVQVDDNNNVYPSVFKLNVRTGAMRQVTRERDPVLRWSADRDGVVRFGFGVNQAGKKGIYLARDSADSDWRVLQRFALFDNKNWHVAGFGVTPNTLLVLADHNGRDALFEMDLSDKTDQQLVFANSTHDIDSPEYWPTDGRFIGVSYETEKPQLELTDPTARAVQLAMDRAIPDHINRVVSASRDSKRLLISSSNDVHPPRYFLFDVAAGRLVEIGQDNAALRKHTLANMRPVNITATDGTLVPGYLTIPVGSNGKNLPGIVLPHGGPYARDSWGYDELVQMLVSRGYAVLQLNYRGSTGYGQAWFDAGFQGWGTAMHMDITAGARWLRDQGIVDPQRLAIVGWSYGGYAALIGAVKEPELYRCAVSIAGVSDLLEWRFQTSRFYGGAAAAANAVGTDDLATQSPRRRAAEIKVPVLLVHGTSDITVKVEHSKDMGKALTRAKKPHELILIKDGGHSLSAPAMRLTLFQALERFLAQHLGS